MKIRFIPVAAAFLLLSFSLAFGQDVERISQSNFNAAKGQVLYERGSYPEAIDALEQAISIRPEHGSAHYYLALAYEKSGERQKAVELLESYVAAVEKTDEWLGSLDREYIAKCKELLAELNKGKGKG